LDVRGADLDPNALDQTLGNLRRAGLQDHVRLRRVDACKLSRPQAGTILISNPPYGERLGGDEVLELYRDMGRQWRAFEGCEAHLIDGHEGFERAFGLRWTDSLRLTNGALPVVLRRYQLGRG
jgi:putative N6-adenine-specific DNA methylase